MPPALRKAGAALAVVLVALLTWAAPASAHASLRSVDPPDGARLDESPERVTLTFSEPVTADLGGVQVFSADGGRVDEGAVQVDGAVVSVGVRPDLPEGTYVIAYRVISADGHPVRGGTVFGVGDVDVDLDAVTAVAGDDDRTWDVVGAVARGLAYAGVLVAAGTALFTVWALGGDAAGATPLRRLVLVAAAVGWVTALVALPVQAALATGRGPGALLDDGVLRSVAGEGLGHSLLLLTAGLVVLLVGLGRSTPATVVGALVAAGSFAATGHNRAGDAVALATVSDVVHLAAAAVWAGGLVALGRTLRHRHPKAAGDAPADPVESGRIVARFSTAATVALVVVAVCGIVLGWNEVRTASGLTGTTYGGLLIAKVGLVAFVAALGAYNRQVLVPSLTGKTARAALRRLRAVVRAEVVGLVAVVAVTSVLVVVTPARTVQAPGIVEVMVDLEAHGSVQVVVDPARPGRNEIHLYTYGSDGRPDDIADEVVIELTLPAVGLGPIERTPTRAGPAHLQLATDDLALAGRWEITVRARVDRFTEAVGTATIDVT